MQPILIFPHLEVKGEATEASNSDNETPTEALLSAPQSFAPSPQKEQVKSMLSYKSTILDKKQIQNFGQEKLLKIILPFLIQLFDPDSFWQKQLL